MAGKTAFKILSYGWLFLSGALLSACGGGEGSAGSGNTAALPVVDVKAFPNLSTAKATLAGRDVILAITSPQNANNLTIPANIRLKFTEAGNLDIAEGKSVTIHGPFEAPLARVFSGKGTVTFGPASVHEVYPEWWGGDHEVESASAIQSAINSIGSGCVLLSAKTYLLNRRADMKLIDCGDTVSAMLVPKSGVNIKGKGYNSVLKVVDNFTEGGDYVIFAPANAEAVSDISFSNFRIDGNGSRNLVQGSTAGTVRRAMAFWLFAGTNIRIDNVWFDNHPGTNVVKFGCDCLSHLVTDSAVTNCTFTSVGAAIPGNRQQSDHCTLYISGRNVTVADNRLSNPGPYDENGPPVAVVAGIEMHGDNMVVSGNSVENYGTGGYIVADGIVSALNQRWVGNRFINMTKIGISIWSVSKVGDILIDANDISLNGELDQGVAGIFQSVYPPDTTVGIDGIAVRNNRIYGTNAKAGTVWNGIQFTAVRNAIIERNVIERMSGAGILIYGNTSSPLDCRNITIKDNTVRDIGFNLYGACPYAIDLTNNGLGIFDAITISGNLVERTLALAEEMRGIRVDGTSPMTGIHIDGTNFFVNLNQEDYWIDYPNLAGSVTAEPAIR